MCRRHFANREIDWMFDQMNRGYPDIKTDLTSRRNI